MPGIPSGPKFSVPVAKLIPYQYLPQLMGPVERPSWVRGSWGLAESVDGRDEALDGINNETLDTFGRLLST
jgi:hypothetical protein